MGKSYYRTFLALPVEAGEDLLELRQSLMASLEEERISWVDPGRYHITLRFLGDTSLSEVAKIASALKEGGLNKEAQQVPVLGVGSFGPRQKPRVIWAGLGGEKWFVELKQAVDNLLEEQGIPRQDAPFRPHLTLGRIRHLQHLSRFHEIIEGMKKISCESLYFNRLVYFRSILDSGGPQYHPLEELHFRRS